MVYHNFHTPSAFAQSHLYFSDGLGYIDTPSFHINRKSFQNNLFMHVLSGKLYVNQRSFHTLIAGDSIVMRLSEEHEYFSDSEDVAHVIWMHFGTPSSCQLLHYIESVTELPFITKSDVIKKNIQTCIRSSKINNSEREYVYSNAIYQNLTHICYLVNQSLTFNNMNTKELFINKVKKYIEENITEQPSLDIFANACGFSKYHFCKLFKEHFNYTPINYYYHLKIEYSKRYLAYSHESISNIALNLGFDSHSHFSKVFKRVVGITPIAFRKKYNA